MRSFPDQHGVVEMIVDTHVHMYKRDMVPDDMVAAYLDPLRKLSDLIDMGLDDEVVWGNFVAGPNDLIASMDAAGVDISIVLPLDYGMIQTPRIDYKEYNRWVFECAEEYPDRIIPFVGVDPRRGRRAIELLEEYANRHGAMGVKVYPATGFYPDDEALEPFWSAVDDLDLLTVTHIGAAWGPMDEKYCHPSRYVKVLERHPSVNFVMAHLGGKWREETLSIVEDYENAYTDCSALQGWLPSNPEMALRRLEEVARRIPDKVIFGSDWPLFELQYTTRHWVNFVKENDWAPEETKEKLFYGTIRRLLPI